MLRIWHFSGLCSLLLATTVVFATPEALDRRQLLDARIVDYMAQQFDLAPESISVGTIDSRILVPNCPFGFRLSLPYSNHKTILAECDDPQWSTYIPIDVRILSDVLVYAGDLPSGRLLSAADLQVETRKTRQRQPVENVEDFVGQLLLRPVKQGQAAKRQHVDTPISVYVLKNPVAAGQRITLENLYTELKGLSSVPANQRVDSALLADVIAARKLGQGQRLVASDLRSRQTRLVVTQPVSYGQALSSENVEVKSVYGVEETQALQSLDGIQQMRTTRTLSVGHILLATDVRPAPLIRKADAVIMSVETGALMLTVGLIAEQDGMLHEVIQLRNPDSGETLQGIVTGAGKVKLQ